MKTVTLKLRRSDVEKMVHKEVTLPPSSKLDSIRNEAVLAWTFAKLYYRGGGWWILSGYAMDGSDVDKLTKSYIVDCLLNDR